MSRGFSLVEMIVVVSMTALVMGVLSMIFVEFYHSHAYVLQSISATQYARDGVEDAMRHLRGATYGSDGSYPIASATPSSLTFFSDVKNTPGIERVTYSLVGDTFFRTERAATGNPPAYNGGDATTTLSSSVRTTNVPLFRYFDENGNELTPPIPVHKISSVRTTLTIDIDINRSPTPFTLSNAATLRNLKSQL